MNSSQIFGSYWIALQLRFSSMVEYSTKIKSVFTYLSDFHSLWITDNSWQEWKNWKEVVLFCQYLPKKLYWINEPRRRRKRNQSDFSHLLIEVPLKSQPPARISPSEFVFKKIRVLKSRNNVNLLVIFIYLSWSVLHCGVNIFIKCTISYSVALRYTLFIHPLWNSYKKFALLFITFSLSHHTFIIYCRLTPSSAERCNIVTELPMGGW